MIGITVTANFCFLASSFIVREYPLYGGELCLSKGVLQVSRPKKVHQQVSKLSSFPDYILHNYCVRILQEEFVSSLSRRPRGQLAPTLGGHLRRLQRSHDLGWLHSPQNDSRQRLDRLRLHLCHLHHRLQRVYP